MSFKHAIAAGLLMIATGQCIAAPRQATSTFPTTFVASAKSFISRIVAFYDDGPTDYTPRR